ncbi:unnamed protein product [Echinostoma caproni]|uniref:Lipase_3 domain-containing protein n=1 Tax=Echinostoma caproni TaxID=27848 RepID=A0A183ARI5_9TREM|nr:unnamed protein product [Echinostoma caproni]
MDASRLLCDAHVKRRLEYGGAATYPCAAGELAKLERVLPAATRLVFVLRGTSYAGRMQATGLFSIAHRLLREDLSCLRKIPRGDMDPELQQYFPLRTEDRT